MLTNKPVEITNIRANRPNPGIKAQHYTAISCMKTLCNAETDGLGIGSPTLTFKPGAFHAGDYTFDIGTAGSMTLVFQACILCSLKTQKPVSIRLVGGSDVKWSPSWDYFSHVFLPLINKMGVKTEAKLLRRGYYPKGSGEAIVTIHPCENITPLHLDEEQEFQSVEGFIHVAGLPDHIGTRMKHAALKILLKKNIETQIQIEKVHALSTGTGITLWSQSNNTVLGSTVLGEKGVPAEQIGENAATQLLSEIIAGATVDVYAIDQVLPYMALAGERGASSCVVRSLSNHARTNMWLIQQFFPAKFETILQDDTLCLITT